MTGSPFCDKIDAYDVLYVEMTDSSLFPYCIQYPPYLFLLTVNNKTEKVEVESLGSSVTFLERVLVRIRKWPKGQTENKKKA